MIPTVCLIVAMSGIAADPVPPPLTEMQGQRIRELVRVHREEQADLKERLERTQKKLAECYSRYDLDDTEVRKLRAEILDLQDKMLSSYDRMQRELRSIVGPERFLILSRRIDNALTKPPEPKKSDPKK